METLVLSLIATAIFSVGYLCGSLLDGMNKPEIRVVYRPFDWEVDEVWEEM